MSFLTTQPEAMAAAATNLQGIDTAMTAQNAAAAAPITGVLPAAADSVSVLQAAQFATYGKLYQQVSAQAAAIQQMFIHTLRTSAESYSATESANATASGSSDSVISDLINLLTGSASGPYGLGGSALSNGAIAGVMQMSNFGSAASDLLQLGSSGFLAPGALANNTQQGNNMPSTVLTHSTEPAAAAGTATVTGAAAPVLVDSGPAQAVGKMSVPPAWAAATEPAASTPVAPRAAGWTTAGVAQAGSSTTVPAGVPAIPAEDRRSGGRLRYGVKPKVMPRPTGV